MVITYDNYSGYFVNPEDSDLRIDIKGGTVRTDQDPLCYSCKWAQVTTGDNMRQEIVRCGMMHKTVRFPVRACNEYLHRNQPSVRDMESIAWILRTDPQRKKIGFIPHKDLDRKEQWAASNDD